MRQKLKEFYSDDSGATAVEYALMAVLIALSGVTSFRAAGGNVEKMYASILKGIGQV